MKKTAKPSRAMIKAALAEIGRRGGEAGVGESKRRGGSKFYRDLVGRRWAAAKK